MPKREENRALLIVVSAPSGAGKSTLCNRLLAEHDDIVYSVSCTTRAPRGQEEDGVAYHFLSEEEFRRRVAAGEFLEHAVVHDNLYGTLRETVETSMAAGKSVLMDIDVEGAGQVRERVRELEPDSPPRAGFVDIFIEPPSMEVLRERLAGRNEDAAEVIERRLRNAAAEMARRHEYRHHVVNDELETAYAELKRVVDDAWGAQAPCSAG